MASVGGAGSVVVAAFDFDGTLTRRDTTLPFLVEHSGRARTAAGLVLAGASALGRERSRAGLKQALTTQLLAGRRLDDVEAAGSTFAAGTGYALRHEVVGLLRWHQDQGHRVVVVSAGLSACVEPVARSLGVQTTLATALETDEGGVLTGRLAGGNLRGEAKVAALAPLLPQGAVLVAYGNSSGDRALLASAQVAVWCGRGAGGHCDARVGQGDDPAAGRARVLVAAALGVRGA